MVERERAEVVEGVGVRPPPVVAALALLDVVVAAEDVDGRHVAVRPDLRAVLREPRLELRLFPCRESCSHRLGLLCCGVGVARTLAVRPLKGRDFQLNPVGLWLILRLSALFPVFPAAAALLLRPPDFPLALAEHEFGEVHAVLAALEVPVLQVECEPAPIALGRVEGDALAEGGEPALRQEVLEEPRVRHEVQRAFGVEPWLAAAVAEDGVVHLEVEFRQDAVHHPVKFVEAEGFAEEFGVVDEALDFRVHFLGLLAVAFAGADARGLMLS